MHCKQVPFVALTATATAAVRDDICSSLRLRNPNVIVSSCDRYAFVSTIHGKILVREKLVNLANYELFTKIFLTSIHRYTEKMYLAYALTVAYSPNFSSPIAFTCMVHQNFPLPNISHVRYHEMCHVILL